MKKIIGILGVAVFAVTLFMNGTILFNNNDQLNSFVSTASASVINEGNEGGGTTYKWRLMTCNNGNTYELCSIYGDGNICSPHMAQTRDCGRG